MSVSDEMGHITLPHNLILKQVIIRLKPFKGPLKIIRDIDAPPGLPRLIFEALVPPTRALAETRTLLIALSIVVALERGAAAVGVVACAWGRGGGERDAETER